MDTRYPDTSDGAIACFLALTEYKPSSEELTAEPDPVVAGVWKVSGGFDEAAAVVYLAGYREPSGQIRQFNDVCVED